jgi:DNA sulfur modification protein DndD
MRLLQMRLQNFRQFQGEQTIEFATPGPGHEQNITVILGENGNGKTGIFRALMFALYGIETLAQDRDSAFKQDAKIHLVNFNEMNRNIGKTVFAEVEIIFEHLGTTYELKRRVSSGKSNVTGEPKPQKKEQSSLRWTDEEGNYSPDVKTDEDEISLEINRILQEQVKDCFFFDGEKIEMIARGEKLASLEIENGINNLLQIDLLMELQSLLEMTHYAEDTKLKHLSKSSRSTHLADEVDQLDQKIETSQTELLKLQSQQLSIDQEKSRIHMLLSQNQLVQEHSQELNKLMVDRRSHLNEWHDTKHDMFNFVFREGANLLLADHYASMNETLKQILLRQKDVIRIEILQKTLESKICFCCGSEIEEWSERWNHVKQLLDDFDRSNVTPIVAEMSANLRDFLFINGEHLNSQTVSNMLYEYSRRRSLLIESDRKIETINKLIHQTADTVEDLQSFTLKLGELISQEKTVISELEVLEMRLEELKKSFVAKKEELNKKQKEEEHIRLDAIAKDHLKTMIQQISSLVESYKSKMKHRLSLETSALFIELIAAKDKSLIHEVIINEDFTFQVRDKNGVNIEQDLSQGQRQMLTLAYIVALSKVASRGIDKVEFPLFMDTPFGRLSGNNRDSLIENMPNLTTQWILLATDTELTATEETILKNTGKLGKAYLLQQNNTFNTKVIELDIHEQISRRGL